MAIGSAGNSLRITNTSAETESRIGTAIRTRRNSNCPASQIMPSPAIAWRYALNLKVCGNTQPLSYFVTDTPLRKATVLTVWSNGIV